MSSCHLVGLPLAVHNYPGVLMVHLLCFILALSSVHLHFISKCLLVGESDNCSERRAGTVSRTNKNCHPGIYLLNCTKQRLVKKHYLIILIPPSKICFVLLFLCHILSSVFFV